MHFQSGEDEVSDAKGCANKDSCICQIDTYCWLFIVIQSGQEGGGHSLDREEAADRNQVKTKHKEIAIRRIIVPEKGL